MIPEYTVCTYIVTESAGRKFKGDIGQLIVLNELYKEPPKSRVTKRRHFRSRAHAVNFIPEFKVIS